MPREAGAAEAAGTVEKAIDVLFHLHAAQAACGVTAIGRDLGIPKSSVHRLLSALARRELVERDARGRYHLGVGLMALGLGVLEREPVVVAARPVLEACAAEVGETFFLVAARAGTLVVLDKAEGTGFLRAAPQVGGVVPVHASAVGKLYLAYAPELLGPSAARSRGKRFTQHTLASAAELQAAAAEVRSQGFARNRDEWIPGLSVLAAPIWLGSRLLAAVALAAATPRISAVEEPMLATRVREAAEKISARLAGSPPRSGAGAFEEGSA